MKRLRILVGFLLVGLVFALPELAQSDRPECPSNHPGACFIAELGFFQGILQESGDSIVVFNQSGESQNWERVSPDGTVSRHSRGERAMNFCPAGVATLNQCKRLNPPDAVFAGIGRTSAVNVDVGSGDCPVSVHLRGTGTNGFGESMKFTGRYVTVRDSNSGQCKTIKLEVEGTPLP